MTPCSPVKTKNDSESPHSKTPEKEEIQDEEENCSSPVKKVKPDVKGKSKTKKGRVSATSKKKSSPKNKKEISSDKEENKVASPSEKEKQSETEASPEKERCETEKATVDKTEKKPKINPFAPKPSSSSSSGSKDVGADYNPGKKKYHPINDAFWKKSER